MSDEGRRKRRGGKPIEVMPKGSQWGHRTLLEDGLHSRHMVLCKCKCGIESRVSCKTLRRRRRTGCAKCALLDSDAFHGDSQLRDNNNYRIYCVYRSVLARCNNPNSRAYPRYGGRGIHICDEWADSYEVFRRWALSNGYAENPTLDRYPDNDGNYEPGNCRWATMKEQSRNRSTSRFIQAFGETKILHDWSEDERCVVGRTTLGCRLGVGMEPEIAMTTPSTRAKKS